MYINRVKQYHARSVQYEHILKKNEQMYALLAMTVALSPASQKVLDENVATQLRERNAEKMAKMVRMARPTLGVWGPCARDGHATHPFHPTQTNAHAHVCAVAPQVRGDVAAFDEAYTYACPKFIAPSLPTPDNLAGNTSQMVQPDSNACPHLPPSLAMHPA